ncbi:hypothetical protein MXD81_54360, partial [Microbacteriaceae bacterium K1510]|nr:hypothetical protein [Microbacteriaceae bacterium K1510]
MHRAIQVETVDLSVAGQLTQSTEWDADNDGIDDRQFFDDRCSGVEHVLVKRSACGRRQVRFTLKQYGNFLIMS